MESIVRIGMDVHQESIRLAVITDSGNGAGGGKIVLEDTVSSTSESVRRTFKKLKKKFGTIECCYEASTCGFVMQRLLNEMKIECSVVAPSMIPIIPGDRVKTDRRDARKLATLFWNDQLTFVRIPTDEEESVRSLVRCRESTMEDLKRTKLRFGCFLKSLGFVYRAGKYWTKSHMAWLRRIELEGCNQTVFEKHLRTLEFHAEELKALDEKIEEVGGSPEYKQMVERLCCLKGVRTLTAMVLIVEIGDFSRFPNARALMSYLGVTPSENSSGNSIHRGGITKAGNKRVRRILVQSAWNYRRTPRACQALEARRKGQPAWVVSHCRKAQKRLNTRFRELDTRKNSCISVVAVARELAGFAWAIMQPEEVALSPIK